MSSKPSIIEGVGLTSLAPKFWAMVIMVNVRGRNSPTGFSKRRYDNARLKSKRGRSVRCGVR